MKKKVNFQRKNKLKLNKVILSIIIFISFVNILNAQTTRWRVIWNANPPRDTVENYKVYRNTIGTFRESDSIATVDSSRQNYQVMGTDTIYFFDDSLGNGLTRGDEYFYWIKAVNKHGPSNEYSDPASAAIPKILLNDSYELRKSSVTNIPRNDVIQDDDHDSDQDSLTWIMNGDTVMSYEDNFLSILIDSIYNAEFTTTQNWLGPVQIDFEVFDPDTFIDVKTVSFSIDSSNRDPSVVAIPDTFVFINILYQYQVEASDLDGDTLVYNLTGNPAWLSINNSTGLMNGTPADTGSYSITVEVDDGNGGNAQTIFDLYVLDPSVNNDPIVQSISDTTIYLNQYYEYQVIATDPDGDTLFYSFSTNPPWLSINNNSGLMQGTPTDTSMHLGISPVTVIVEDGNTGIDSVSFNITVLDSVSLNTPPYFTSDPVLTAIIGEIYFYEATAIDDEGDNLIYWINTPFPQFLDTTLTDTSIKIVGSPGLNDLKEHSVILYVSDGIAGVDTQEYTLTVRISPLEGTESEIKRFPNPWIASQSQYSRIIFDNIPSGAQLLLYNLLGEPVFSTKVETQPFLWNVKNNSGLEVQSGMYFYYVKNGSEILKAGKIVIIR